MNYLSRVDKKINQLLYEQAVKSLRDTIAIEALKYCDALSSAPNKESLSSCNNSFLLWHQQIQEGISHNGDNPTLFDDLLNSCRSEFNLIFEHKKNLLTFQRRLERIEPACLQDCQSLSELQETRRKLRLRLHSMNFSLSEYSTNNTLLDEHKNHLLQQIKQKKDLINNYFGEKKQAIEAAKVTAFQKIYRALYEGKSSFFKRQCAPIDTLNTVHAIVSYVEENPKSRSATAWRLADQHYNNPSVYNLELFKHIHQYAFKHSSSCFGLFKRTQIAADYHDARQKIDMANDDSHTGKIKRALE